MSFQMAVGVAGHQAGVGKALPAPARWPRYETCHVGLDRIARTEQFDEGQAIEQFGEARQSAHQFGSAQVVEDVGTDDQIEATIEAQFGRVGRARQAQVACAADDLYLTGGTLVIDHGHGFSSNFLHLSRLDAKVGERVEQGQVIVPVGASGRASGPHLHWGMNWFDVRIDPQQVLDAANHSISH